MVKIKMLRTKSIDKRKHPNDGTRISIMSRHTLNDGKTPDPKITADSYHEHIRELAPPDKLIGDYYKRKLPWQEYKKRYLEHLSKPETNAILKKLIERALRKNITLLCVEKTHHKCHRGILTEEMQKLEPKLKIKHK